IIPSARCSTIVNMVCIIHDSAAKKKVPSHDCAKGADKSIDRSEPRGKSLAKIRNSSKYPRHPKLMIFNNISFVCPSSCFFLPPS
ncbi:MAG: hypothetical protein ACM34A_01310, partial [Bacillota bacterium]